MKLSSLKVFILILLSVFVYVSADSSKTVITGSQMEMQKSGKIVIFSDGARVQDGENILTAEKIIQNKEENTVNASGNVIFDLKSEDGSPVYAVSDNAFYDLSEKEGKLWGEKSNIYYDKDISSSSLKLSAETIIFSNIRRDISAEGNVEIVSSSITAISDFAHIDRTSRKIVLTGNFKQPKVMFKEGSSNGDFIADKISIFPDDRKMFLYGNVKAKIVDLSDVSGVN